MLFCCLAKKIFSFFLQNYVPKIRTYSNWMWWPRHILTRSLNVLSHHYHPWDFFFANDKFLCIHPVLYQTPLKYLNITIDVYCFLCVQLNPNNLKKTNSSYTIQINVRFWSIFYDINVNKHSFLIDDSN